jgi:hypothetical protein
MERSFFAGESLNQQAGVLINKYAHPWLPLPCRGDDLFRSVLHSIRNDEVEPGCAQDFLPLFDICTFKTHNDRNLRSYILRRLNDSGGDNIAAHNASEYIDQDRFDAGIGEQNPEGILHLLCRGAASHIEKVRRAPSCELDDVHCRHGESRAIDHAGDIAVELDVVQTELARFDLERFFFVQIAKFLDVLVAVQCA